MPSASTQRRWNKATKPPQTAGGVHRVRRTPSSLYTSMEKKIIQSPSDICAAFQELREERGLTYYAAAKRHNSTRVSGARVKEWEQSSRIYLESVLAHLEALGAKMTIEW